MKRILIAIGYHPVSEEIAEAGCNLAKELGGEVCLLHVLSTPQNYGIHYPDFLGFTGEIEPFFDDDQRENLMEIAKEFLGKATKHLDYPNLTTKIAFGETSKVILDYAKEWKADLIVLGTHSRGILQKVFMGSRAARVIENTPVPVYLVPVKKD